MAEERKVELAVLVSHYAMCALHKIEDTSVHHFLILHSDEFHKKEGDYLFIFHDLDTSIDFYPRMIRELTNLCVDDYLIREINPQTNVVDVAGGRIENQFGLVVETTHKLVYSLGDQS